jgi:hypothetical protein
MGQQRGKVAGAAARRSSRSAALSDDTCDDGQSSGLGARVMRGSGDARVKRRWHERRHEDGRWPSTDSLTSM